MTIQHHQPWKPTCWVGGSMFRFTNAVVWIGGEQQLCELSNDSREKYAATKATAAILKSMRAS